MALGTLSALLFLAMPSLLSAQSKADSRRFTASFSAGIARPSDEAFRALYGSIQYPVSIQVDYGLSPNVLIFGAFDYVCCSGKVPFVEAAFAPGGDLLKIRTRTANAGLLLVFPLRKFSILAGGGGGFRFYEETWDAAGITTSGNKAGLVLQGGVEYELARTLALVARIGYSRMEIKAESISQNDASLSRWESSIGFSFRLHRLFHK
jgi:opacity protein-like surface antigen